MVSEIKAVLIFEMLGRPAEHLEATLDKFMEKIAEEKGVEILNKKISEPKRIEKAKQELFTTFSETEFIFADLTTFLRVVFIYMPSHIEVSEPDRIEFENYDFNSLMNEIIRRLHQYDEIAKKMVIERNILQKQLQQQGLKPAVPSILHSPEAKEAQETDKEKTEKKEHAEKKKSGEKEGKKDKKERGKKKSEKKRKKTHKKKK